MIRVGLTGGTGAGKSTAAHTLAGLGGYLVDADKIAREVVEPGTPGLAALTEAFGPGILAADGSLDRPALAARAFADDESRAMLNAITHPAIMARTAELTAAAPADAIIVHDVPLLVENGMAPFYHLVAVVHAPIEARLERLTGKRGMAPDDARARIAAQATDEQRRAVADVWLDNSGPEADLVAAVTRLWEERLVPLERNVRQRTPAAVPETPASEYDALTARLISRLWALCGDRASAVTAGHGNSGILAHVTAHDSAAAAALVDVLADGGFPSEAPGLYGSADPGRAVTVEVTTPKR